jgi:hypothetical protein
MGFESVHIEQLCLRVPGLTQPEAHRLAEEVAHQVSCALPAERSVRHLGLLDLRISIPTGVPRELLAERIAERILMGLR